MKHEYTSERIAAIAARVLRDPLATEDARALAGSALTQARDTGAGKQDENAIEALTEAVLDAADEWNLYVEVDSAPRRLREHIQKAIDAVHAKAER